MRGFSNYIKFVLPFMIFLVSCEKDDDHDDHDDHDHTVVAPNTMNLLG